MTGNFFKLSGFAARPPRAVIYGMAGESLTGEEREFFAAANPFGFILFARNCNNPQQVKDLISSLHDVCGREQLPILIDQEGGRVARLTPPHWRKSPPAGDFATLALRDVAAAEKGVYYNARLIAAEVAELGINIDCAPVLDIRHEDADDIIGDRAYGTQPDMVARLARQMAQGLLDGGVLPVIKHIPGHGRALVDSHKDLPVVDVPRETLYDSDFAPFRSLSDMPLAMTAHILYPALDDSAVATLSPVVISLIREEIGFSGLLMSDDISMKALQGKIADLSQAVLDAGCDLVLHCNGDMNEMREISSVIPPVTEIALERTERAFAMLHEPQPLDKLMAEREVEIALSAPAAASSG